MLLLPNAKLFKLAPDLGLCVALCDPEGLVAYGHLHNITMRPEKDPSPDLRSMGGPEGFAYVEALTEDGHAFLALLREPV